MAQLLYPLCGARVCIRPLDIADAEVMCAAVWASQQQLQPWLSWANDYSLSDAQQFLTFCTQQWCSAKPVELHFAVMPCQAQEDLWGVVGLHHLDPLLRRAQIGYWLHTDCCGQGYMQEAITLLTEYATEQLALKRLEIHCAANNLRSRRMAEQLSYVAHEPINDVIPYVYENSQ